MKSEDMALHVGAKTLHEGRRSMYEQAAEYHGRFIDSQSGLVKEKYIEKRTCPVCKKNNTNFMFHKGGGTYVQCLECTMVYLNPVFTDTALQSFYENNNSSQAEVVANEGGFYERIYSKGLSAIEAFKKKQGKLLDVGCSSGAFLDIAKKKNWTTFGIELNQKELETARNKGHEISHVSLYDFSPRTPAYDAVSLWDVFEHIKEPYAALEVIKSILVNDGVLFLQTPNVHSLAARIMHEKSNLFDGIEHVNLYNVASLTKVLNDCGFKVASCETVISEIPVINNFLNYADPYFGEVGGKAVLDIIDEEGIHKAGLGYKFQMVAVKS